MPYLFILLNVLDALLTMVGIANGKKELNPAASWLMEQAGVLPAVVLVKLVSVVIVLAIARRLSWLLPVGCVIVGFAVLWNLSELLS
jgi:hypothetical protein